jgi:hypothetical protein
MHAMQRFTTIAWSNMRTCLGLHDIIPSRTLTHCSFGQGVVGGPVEVIHRTSQATKALFGDAIFREIRNARVFRNQYSTTTTGQVVGKSRTLCQRGYVYRWPVQRMVHMQYILCGE